MKHVLEGYACCVLVCESDNKLTECVFCDLDMLSLQDLRQEVTSRRIFGFYNKKISAEKKALCEAVFKKNIPAYQLCSFLFNARENLGQYHHNDIMLLKSLHRGLSDKQISFDMGLPLSTVKYYLRCLYKKLNVSNRTQAALAAHEFIV